MDMRLEGSVLYMPFVLAELSHLQILYSFIYTSVMHVRSSLQPRQHLDLLHVSHQCTRVTFQSDNPPRLTT